jgi:hypothetical protein
MDPWVRNFRGMRKKKIKHEVELSSRRERKRKPAGEIRRAARPRGYCGMNWSAPASPVLTRGKSTVYLLSASWHVVQVSRPVSPARAD